MKELTKLQELADIITFHLIQNRLQNDISVRTGKGLLTFAQDEAVFTVHVPQPKPLIWFDVFTGIMDFFGFACLGEQIYGGEEDENNPEHT